MESPELPGESSHAQDSSVAKEEGRGRKPFTENNFRENLAHLTGRILKGAHAHHVLPLKLAKLFKKVGSNVNESRCGAWWERSSHLKRASEYNQLWEKFLELDRIFEQILEFGRKLAGEFGFQVNY